MENEEKKVYYRFYKADGTCVSDVVTQEEFDTLFSDTTKYTIEKNAPFIAVHEGE